MHIINYFFAICYFFLFFSDKTEQNKKGELIITGVIKDEKMPVLTVYAMFIDGNKKEGIDSAKVINGKYQFRAITEATTLVTLYKINPNMDGAYRKENIFVLLSEPATIFVIHSNSFSNATVSGSKANTEYKRLEIMREHYFSQLNESFENYSRKKARNDSIGMEKIQSDIDSVKEALAREYWTYIKTHPNSPALTFAASNFILNHKNYSDNDIEELTNIYDLLAPEARNSYYGQRLQKKLQSLTITIGMNAPLFVQNDTSGTPVSLESFRGKYVLLDFWASWCIPCRNANPELVKSYNKYKNKGFTIVSISMDKASDVLKWKQAIIQDKLTWTNLSDLRYWENSVAKLLKVYAIPQNFLIDPQGKIIAKDVFGNNLEKTLDALVK